MISCLVCSATVAGSRRPATITPPAGTLPGIGTAASTSWPSPWGGSMTWVVSPPTDASSSHERCGEPALDVLLQQHVGVDEHHQHRHQRQADVGRHQLALELRPEHSCAPLEQQLEDAAGEHEEHRQDEDEVDVEEDEEQDAVGDQQRWQVAALLQQVEDGGEADQQHAEHAQDEPGVLAPLAEAVEQPAPRAKPAATPLPTPTPRFAFHPYPPVPLPLEGQGAPPPWP